MRKLILLLLLLSALLPVQAQQKFDVHPLKKIDANPVNVAYLLSQDSDSARIASTLAYYGYAPIPNTERSSDTASANTSYSTYRHPNGNIIRIAPPSGGWGAAAYPSVEVKPASGRYRSTDATLTDLQFRKTGNIYLRKAGQYARTETRCRHLSGGFLSFQRQRIL